MMRFSTCTSPEPWQVGQRSLGTFPLPRHTGQGRLTAKLPWPKEIVPRPLHSGQVEIVAPGAAPRPLHVGHTSGSVSVIGILPPSAAVRNGIGTITSTVSSSSSFRLPKMELKRSPRPPNEPRSERSKSPPLSPPDAPAGPRRPAPANAPYRRS